MTVTQVKNENDRQRREWEVCRTEGGRLESMKGVRMPLKGASGAGVDKTGVATVNVADSIQCCPRMKI